MKQIIILFLLTGISFAGYSQTGNSSEQKLKIGFNFGLNYSNLQSNEDPLPNYAEFSNALGYQLGILLDYSLTDRMSFNPRVEVVFNNGTVLFPNHSEAQRVHEVMPVGLDIMTYVTYQFGNGKMKPYLLFGPDIKLPYLKNVRSSLEFSSSTDIAIDIGIGLDYAMKNRSISPELRYSYGLSMQSHPNLQSLYLHSISLVLNVK